MNKPNNTHSSPPRPQFRLGSLMAFTTGLCAVSAVLAALHIHPLHVLFAVVLFSLGVAAVAVPVELIIMANGTRDRQRHGVQSFNAKPQATARSTKPSPAAWR